MFARPLTLAALTSIPLAARGLDILQALNQSGLDQLANVTGSLYGTPGQYLLTELSQGNNAIFGPTDSALSDLTPAVAYNGTSLADLVSYHVVSGDFVNQTQTYPSVTIGRTLLNDSNLVMLEGNKSQVLVWSKSDNGSIFVMNNGVNVSVVNTTTYDNTTILAIDSVLTPPSSIPTILGNDAYDLSAVSALLESIHLPQGSSLLSALTSARGITVFAPNNAGIAAAVGYLSGIAHNTTALLDLFYNHLINGTSVYSTEISNGTTAVSAGGQDCVFVVNSTGYYVSVGGSNQVEIVETNVLASNGVVHIINGVMHDVSENAVAASSAYATATSVAGHATQSGPVTVPATTT